jgi:diguanylate cyclase (GGDEF)-like protein
MRPHDRAGIDHGRSLEKLLRSLLAADGRDDAELRVVEGVRSLLGADWVALLEPSDGRWVCRRESGATFTPAAVWEEGEAARESRASRLLGGSGPASAALGADLEVDSGTFVLLVGPGAADQDYARRDAQLLTEIAPDLALTLRRAEELDRLRAQALVDALTSCYNRRGFDEQLAAELRRAQCYERPAALMLVDLDAFKRINDELGHQAGDHVLKRFASLLSRTFRQTDVVSRYGGDEFAVVFPETTTEKAEQLAQRVRRLLGGTFPDEVIPRSVNASFGIASYPRDAQGAEELIAAADRALYAAKTGGRDRVVAAEPRNPSEP